MTAFRFHLRLAYWNIFILVVISILIGSSPARVAVSLVVGVSLILLVSHVLRIRVVDPLSDLSSAIKAISEGDMDKRVAIRGDKGIADLIRATNVMTRNLGDREKELREDRRKFESFLQAMTEGVMILDSSGRVLFTNSSVLKMLGTDRELSGKTTLDLFRNPELEAEVKGALSRRVPEPVNMALGSGRLFEAQIAGIPNLSGVVDSVIVVFHDQTEIRKTERMRRDFVANVSHEFKTPLTAIRGYTETLLGGALDDREIAEDFLRIVERNARHLESLVTDLLTLARIEAELPASVETIDLKVLVDEQVALRQSTISERGIKVTNDCPSIGINADRVRLGTAVSNLIDNAVHYNRPSGEIQISGVQENGSFILSIADTGEGIPASDLQRIFERFYRVDKARTRASGGTGLGLAIVKHAIESLGGSITVSSKLGAGSKFSIQLPMQRN